MASLHLGHENGLARAEREERAEELRKQGEETASEMEDEEQPEEEAP